MTKWLIPALAKIGATRRDATVFFHDPGHGPTMGTPSYLGAFKKSDLEGGFR